MMKYKVNDSCIGCGLCESTCPEVFHMNGDVAVAIEGEVPESALASAAEAKEGCPVGAIETMTHGHEVLAMMQGNSYTEKSLMEAIIEKFGAEERFYTCSAENLTAQELIDFLKDHGKFMPMDDGFTADASKVCENE